MKSNDKEFIVKQDEWLYTNNNSNSRKKVKRNRNKAIRRKIKNIKKDFFSED